MACNGVELNCFENTKPVRSTVYVRYLGGFNMAGNEHSAISELVMLANAIRENRRRRLNT